MVIKRTYIIPLRKEFLKAPNYNRSKKAVTGLIDFLKKHMKSEDIKIGPKLNDKVWEHGIKNPPHHVEVAVLRTDEGQVRAELVGFEKDFLEPKVEVKNDSKLKTVDKKNDSSSLEKAVEKEESSTKTVNSEKKIK